MTGTRRIVAAMSGGVDSAVAAARMKAAGFDVVGVHLALSKNPETGEEHGRGCCTLSDARDARRSADILGIPFYVWDFAADFAETVIDDFVTEYASGRTPNPCLRCNEHIKFAAVLDRALALGFDGVATGHYARLLPGTAGVELHRALDPEKDQSYVLSVLTPEQLAHSYFPLGDTLKSGVRREAQALGLYIANKPDSYDICFIPDGDTAGWLHRRLGQTSGDIVDAQTGQKLGEHLGTHAYTIGQRRGLGVTTAPADGRPRYVVGLDTETNTVSLGPPRLLDVDVLETGPPLWLNETPITGADCIAQVRAHGDPIAATVAESSREFLKVRTSEVIRGVAPGQTLALYDGTRVVGSATIHRTRRAQSAVATARLR